MDDFFGKNFVKPLLEELDREIMGEVRNMRMSEWFDKAMREACENERLQVKGDRYLDGLKAGGSLPGMLRFMAGEYTGRGGQSEPLVTANHLKREALLKAADLIERVQLDG